MTYQKNSNRSSKIKSSLLVLCALIITSTLNAEIRTQHYKDGSIKETSNIINGKKEGVTKGYFENGKLDFLSTFKNDQFDGLSELYYENGQLFERMYFINGKRNGEYITYYKDGKLKARIHFKHGKRVGKHIQYDQKGKIISELLFGEPRADGFSLNIKQGRAHENIYYEESFIVDILEQKRKNKETEAQFRNGAVRNYLTYEAYTEPLENKKYRTIVQSVDVALKDGTEVEFDLYLLGHFEEIIKTVHMKAKVKNKQAISTFKLYDTKEFPIEQVKNIGGHLHLGVKQIVPLLKHRLSEYKKFGKIKYKVLLEFKPENIKNISQLKAQVIEKHSNDKEVVSQYTLNQSMILSHTIKNKKTFQNLTIYLYREGLNEQKIGFANSAKEFEEGEFSDFIVTHSKNKVKENFITVSTITNFIDKSVFTAALELSCNSNDKLNLIQITDSAIVKNGKISHTFSERDIKKRYQVNQECLLKARGFFF